MNLEIIKKLSEKREGGLKKIAADVGMSEQNLHRCIRNNKIQASDLENIATLLGVNIDVFFEETPSAPAAGSSTSVLSHNYIEGDGNLSGNQILSPGVPVAAADGDGDDSPAVLRERVKALQQLLDEKERTIKILLDKKRNE